MPTTTTTATLSRTSTNHRRSCDPRAVLQAGGIAPPAARRRANASPDAAALGEEAAGARRPGRPRKGTVHEWTRSDGDTGYGARFYDRFAFTYEASGLLAERFASGCRPSHASPDGSGFSCAFGRAGELGAPSAHCTCVTASSGP
jgi:hypothetical protein